jgi:hypothetical protein
MQENTTRLWAVALECVGIAVTGVGIGCELAFGGDLHLVVITVGSCLISVGGLLWAKVR